MRLLPLVALALGCRTPYQSEGLRGGYRDTHLGGTRWLITVEVNSLTSRTRAVEYAYRRAAELCPGGFDPLSGDSTRSDHYVNGQNMLKSDATLVVECRAAQHAWTKQQQQTSPQPHSAAQLPARRFCFSKLPRSGGKTAMDCAATSEACRSSLDGLGQLWTATSGCAAVPSP